MVICWHPLSFSKVFVYVDHAILKKCFISINYYCYCQFLDVRFFLCSIINKARSAMEVLREVLDALNPQNPEVGSMLLYDFDLSNEYNSHLYSAMVKMIKKVQSLFFSLLVSKYISTIMLIMVLVFTTSHSLPFDLRSSRTTTEDNQNRCWRLCGMVKPSFIIHSPFYCVLPHICLCIMIVKSI